VGYIYGLLVVALFFATMHYFTELNRSQKIIASLFTMALIFSAVAYNNYTQAQQDKILEVVRKFKVGETLQCNGIKINTTNFSLSIGTYTFIGKENTPHYGQMVNASTCQ
jgi:hypothetical protein